MTTQILENLKNLSDGEFAELLLRYGMPIAHLPDGPRTVKSIAVIRYAEARQELDRLQVLIAEVSQRNPVKSVVKKPWLWWFIAIDTLVALVVVGMFWEQLFPAIDPLPTGPGTPILADCSPQRLEQADVLFRQACADGATTCTLAGLRKVLELCPEHPEANNNLGVAYENLGDYAKAAEYYQQAARSGENFWIAWFNLGEIQEKHLNQPAAALYAYAHACKDHPPAMARVAALKHTSSSVPAAQQDELRGLLSGCGF